MAAEAEPDQRAEQNQNKSDDIVELGSYFVGGSSGSGRKTKTNASNMSVLSGSRAAGSVLSKTRAAGASDMSEFSDSRAAIQALIKTRAAGASDMSALSDSPAAVPLVSRSPAASQTKHGKHMAGSSDFVLAGVSGPAFIKSENLMESSR